LTANEAAITLGVEVDYILRLLRAKKLRGRKVDGRWVVDNRSVSARLIRIKGEYGHSIDIANKLASS
jgi:excisionase family DNA binding protein